MLQCWMLTSLKMHRLLPLAALLLSIPPTVNKVVPSISDCAEFFLQQTPPNIPGILENGNILNQNRYKPICQTWKDTERFVTLYDIQNKIPVFSASKYKGSKGKRPKGEKWKIEPQLEDISNNNNMRKSGKQIYHNQAGDRDYTNQGYTRGHLFPSCYASTNDDKKSTFTLTNAVPQEGTFNKGSWSSMEKCIKCVLDEYCKNNNDIIEGFLVTGAQPGTKSISNKVNVPSKLWSAFCCFSPNVVPGGEWIASAHWGENVAEDIQADLRLQTKTLEELSNELGTLNSHFDMFPGPHCPRDTTVTQLYPKLDETCKCPRPISTTSAPTTTSTPPISTSAPLSTTSAPLSTTSAPLSTTSAPLSTTSAPLSTTSAPLLQQLQLLLLQPQPPQLQRRKIRTRMNRKLIRGIKKTHQ